MTVRSRHATIIALHDMTYSSRVFKQADALHDAGFVVTLVGIVQRSTDPTEEGHPFGRVIRVRTTRHLHAESQRQGTPSDTRIAPRGSALKGIRIFLGRMRDNRLLARAAIATDCDVVIASDLTAWAAGWMVKRRTGTPLVLDVRDLVTDSGRNHPCSYNRLLGWLERVLIHRADAVTAASPGFVDVLAKRYPRAPKATAVYSGAFERVPEAVPAHQPLRLFFQGRFAANRRLDELVRAVAQVETVDVRLTLQGFGEEEQRIRALVAELDAGDRIEFIPPCGPREVVRCASVYDVGIINYHGDTLNLRLTVPIKLLDYMAAGLAVLASDLPAVRSVIEAERCGALFAPDGADSLARAIETIADDTAVVTEMKANAVRASERYLSANQGQVFVEVVNGLLGFRADAPCPKRAGS